MKPIPVRVVKLGGSLFDCADLADRLRAWFATQTPAVNLLVVGGGRYADAVRHYDEVLQLGDDAHWLAIRAMNLAAMMVCNLLPEVGSPRLVVQVVEHLRDRSTSRVIMVDALDFVLKLEHDSTVASLPRTWDVTSDSIAARLAEFVSADELVLLKSTLPLEAAEQHDRSDCGIVDRYFRIASARVRKVRLVNLRAHESPGIESG